MVYTDKLGGWVGGSLCLEMWDVPPGFKELRGVAHIVHFNLTHKQKKKDDNKNDMRQLLRLSDFHHICVSFAVLRVQNERALSLSAARLLLCHEHHHKAAMARKEAREGRAPCRQRLQILHKEGGVWEDG